MPKIVADDTVYNAVIEVLKTHGYSGATTKLIAELAGVNETTLYRKYGTKEQLVKNAVEYIIDRVDIDSIAYYTGDIHADLVRLFNGFFQSVEHTGGDIFMVLTAEMNRFPELQSISLTPFKMISKVGLLLARYQAEGILRQEHPFLAVLSFMAPMALSRRLSLISDGPSFPQLDADTYVDGYINGRLLKSES